MGLGPESLGRVVNIFTEAWDSCTRKSHHLVTPRSRCEGTPDSLPGITRREKSGWAPWPGTPKFPGRFRTEFHWKDAEALKAQTAQAWVNIRAKEEDLQLKDHTLKKRSAHKTQLSCNT